MHHRSLCSWQARIGMDSLTQTMNYYLASIVTWPGLVSQVCFGWYHMHQDQMNLCQTSSTRCVRNFQRSYGFLWHLPSGKSHQFRWLAELHRSKLLSETSCVETGRRWCGWQSRSTWHHESWYSTLGNVVIHIWCLSIVVLLYVEMPLVLLYYGLLSAAQPCFSSAKTMPLGCSSFWAGGMVKVLWQNSCENVKKFWQGALTQLPLRKNGLHDFLHPALQPGWASWAQSLHNFCSLLQNTWTRVTFLTYHDCTN